MSSCSFHCSLLTCFFLNNWLPIRHFGDTESQAPPGPWWSLSLWTLKSSISLVGAVQRPCWPLKQCCLHPSALVLIIFTERVGCSYPTYLVSLKTNKTTLTLDIPLALITVTTPHSGWRPGEILSGKFCFPNSFIVSAWLGNQVALAEGKFLHTPPFLFLVCVDVAPPHSPPSWSPGRCREVLATGVSVWVAWHPSLGKGRKSLPGWQAQASPSKCPLKCLWQVPELVSHSSQPRRFQERNLDLLSNPWASTTFVKNKYLRWTFLSGSHKQIPSGHNLFHR